MLTGARDRTVVFAIWEIVFNVRYRSSWEARLFQDGRRDQIITVIPTRRRPLIRTACCIYTGYALVRCNMEGGYIGS